MGNQLRFDDRVAVITGAGNGLGRAHALLLAARGAKVVVNDLGGTSTGGGKSSAAADAVVAQIKEAGGEAVANYDSVEEGGRIIEQAMDAFGRIDVVINNAGILRDTSFHKMSPEDWDLIYRVHVKGSFEVTHAAWTHMREQRYGRIVMTASAAGIYGNFGQANYSMAKLGLHGLSNTLAIEGAGRGIQVNTIAPIAGSRLTETVLPKDLTDALKPEYVSPLVTWLCHEDCEETGGLFEVGGGYFGKLRWQRAQGQMFRQGRALSPEDVQRTWSVIAGFEEVTYPSNVAESLTPIIENINAGPSRGGNEYIDVDAALAYRFPERSNSYDERDLSIYALGVGAAADPSDNKDLQLVYEMHQDGFLPLPSYGVIPAVNNFLALAKEGVMPEGFNFGLERILHGEQRMQLTRPLPVKAKLTHKMRVKDIYDKGKHAMMDVETKSYDEDGELLMVNNLIAVIRGVGGWGGERGPNRPRNPTPEGAPQATVQETINANQALLYRLSGDWNPLHADPNFASAMGFERPILHGLCTLGYAMRHVIQTFAPNNDPRFVKGLEVRMSKSVFPGETVVTEMWQQDEKVFFVTKVKDRDEVALTQAVVEFWKELPEKKAKAEVAAEPAAKQEGSADAATLNSGAVFTAIGAYVKAHPELKDKIKTIYQFQLSEPASVWTLDLKAGQVSAGESAKPQCTLALSDANFMAMVNGAKDPQQMFMKGELKISGDLMASQKLTFLTKVDPKDIEAAASAPTEVAAPAPSAPSREAVGQKTLKALTQRLKDSPELAKEVQADVRFCITEPTLSFTARLKDNCEVIGDDTADVDVTLTLTDEDLEALLTDQVSARSLHQRGQLQVDGDLSVAHRLGFLKNLI